MTCDDYRAVVRSLGLTACRPSFQGNTVHQDRDGGFIQVEDPESLSEEERVAALGMLKFRLGIIDN